MDDERRRDQHQRRRGEPIHPHQHAHQSEAEHRRARRARRGDEEAQERAPGIVGRARQDVLRLGILEEGEVERRRMVEDPARELEVQDVAEPLLGVAPQRRRGALEQHQDQAHREPQRGGADVESLGRGAHRAVDRGDDEADRERGDRRQQRGEQRRDREQVDEPGPGAPGEGERPTQGGTQRWQVGAAIHLIEWQRAPRLNCSEFPRTCIASLLPNVRAGIDDPSVNPHRRSRPTNLARIDAQLDVPTR